MTAPAPRHGPNTGARVSPDGPEAHRATQGDFLVSEMPRDEGFQITLYDDGRIVCDIATPTLWIADHELNQMTEPGNQHKYLSFRQGVGDVVLTADNGTWIWRLTGRVYIHHYGPGTTPLTLCEARWPD